MSKVKAGGKSKNNRKTAGKRLGVKLQAGQRVKTGQIIVRQVGQNKRAGPGTYISRNFSIHARRDGVVWFVKRRFRSFSGRSISRTQVQVIDDKPAD